MAARSPLDKALAANSLAAELLLPTPTNINPIHMPGPELLAFIRVQQWVADKLRMKLPLLHGIFVLVPSQQLPAQGASSSAAAAASTAIPWRLRQVSAVEAPPGADPASATVLLVGGGQVAAGAVKQGPLEEVPEHEYLCCELAQQQASGELRALRVFDEAHVAWRLKVACQLDAAIQAYKKEQATALASPAHEPQLSAKAAQATLRSMHAILKQLPPPGWVDNEVLQHVELNPIVWPEPPDAPWTLLSAEEYNHLLQDAAAAWQQYVQHKLAGQQQPLQPLTDTVPWIPLAAVDAPEEVSAEEHTELVEARAAQLTQSSSATDSDLSAPHSDEDSLQPWSQTAAAVTTHNVNGTRRFSTSASSHHIPNPNMSFSPTAVHRRSAPDYSPSLAPPLPSAQDARRCITQHHEDDTQQDPHHDLQQHSMQRGLGQSSQGRSSKSPIRGRSCGMAGTNSRSRSRSRRRSRSRSRSRSQTRACSPGRSRSRSWRLRNHSSLSRSRSRNRSPSVRGQSQPHYPGLSRQSLGMLLSHGRAAHNRMQGERLVSELVDSEGDPRDLEAAAQAWMQQLAVLVASKAGGRPPEPGSKEKQGWQPLLMMIQSTLYELPLPEIVARTYPTPSAFIKSRRELRYSGRLNGRGKLQAGFYILKNAHRALLAVTQQQQGEQQVRTRQPLPDGFESDDSSSARDSYDSSSRDYSSSNGDSAADRPAYLQPQQQQQQQQKAQFQPEGFEDFGSRSRSRSVRRMHSQPHNLGLSRRSYTPSLGRTARRKRGRRRSTKPRLTQVSDSSDPEFDPQVFAAVVQQWLQRLAVLVACKPGGRPPELGSEQEMGWKPRMVYMRSLVSEHPVPNRIFRSYPSYTAFIKTRPELEWCSPNGSCKGFVIRPEAHRALLAAAEKAEQQPQSRQQRQQKQQGRQQQQKVQHQPDGSDSSSARDGDDSTQGYSSDDDSAADWPAYLQPQRQQLLAAAAAYTRRCQAAAGTGVTSSAPGTPTAAAANAAAAQPATAGLQSAADEQQVQGVASSFPKRLRAGEQASILAAAQQAADRLTAAQQAAHSLAAAEQVANSLTAAQRAASIVEAGVQPQLLPAAAAGLPAGTPSQSPLGPGGTDQLDAAVANALLPDALTHKRMLAASAQLGQQPAQYLASIQAQIRLWLQHLAQMLPQRSPPASVSVKQVLARLDIPKAVMQHYGTWENIINARPELQWAGGNGKGSGFSVCLHPAHHAQLLAESKRGRFHHS